MSLHERHAFPPPLHTLCVRSLLAVLGVELRSLSLLQADADAAAAAEYASQLPGDDAAGVQQQQPEQQPEQQQQKPEEPQQPPKQLGPLPAGEDGKQQTNKKLGAGEQVVKDWMEAQAKRDSSSGGEEGAAAGARGQQQQPKRSRKLRQQPYGE